MDALGISISEQEIRQKCDCDEEGTTPENLVIAACDYGFQQTKYFRLGHDEQAGLGELQSILARGIYPIVFLKMSPPFDLHAVVVIGFMGDGITVLDPYLGERNVVTHSFLAEWVKTKQTIILVE